jgi:hypothetical protein
VAQAFLPVLILERCFYSFSYSARFRYAFSVLSLKGITAKRADAMLGLTGNPFWQEESYDHLVRHDREFEKIRNDIEVNPVRAGLVREAGAKLQKFEC